jgi:hypothetical protein
MPAQKPLTQSLPSRQKALWPPGWQAPSAQIVERQSAETSHVVPADAGWQVMPAQSLLKQSASKRQNA